MFKNAKDWHKTRRNNRIGIGLGLIGVLLMPWASARFGIDRAALGGATFGFLGVCVLNEVWLYRKPPKPDQAMVDKLERENIPAILISTLATWGFLGCFLVATYVGVESALYAPFLILGIGLFLVALAMLPRLLAHMRYSRVAPELHDERSQSNLDKAYRQGFLVMFQASFLGGLALMFGVISVPAEYVAMGLGIIGMMTVSLLWCWYDWQDAR